MFNLSKATLSLTTSSTHTKQVKTLHMDLFWDHFNSSLQAKTHIWPQKQQFGYVAFHEKFDTPQSNKSSVSPVSESSTHPLEIKYAFSHSPPGQELCPLTYVLIAPSCLLQFLTTTWTMISTLFYFCKITPQTIHLFVYKTPSKSTFEKETMSIIQLTFCDPVRWVMVWKMAIKCSDDVQLLSCPFPCLLLTTCKYFVLLSILSCRNLGKMGGMGEWQS